MTAWRARRAVATPASPPAARRAPWRRAPGPGPPSRSSSAPIAGVLVRSELVSFIALGSSRRSRACAPLHTIEASVRICGRRAHYATGLLVSEQFVCEYARSATGEGSIDDDDRGLRGAGVLSRPASRRAARASRPARSGLISSLVIGVASTAPAYSLAATLGFVTFYRRPAVAGGDAARLRPHAVHRGGVLLPEPGRPRLRHHLHLGHPGHGPQHGVAGGVGHPHDRPGGHAQPGLDRRRVHVLAVRRPRHRQRQLGVLGHLRRAWSGSSS